MRIKFLVVILIVNSVVNAQVTPPRIGSVITNYEFTDVENYHSSKIVINQFKGKWLILDFWSESCSGCIASFPEISKIYSKYGDSMQLISVGANNSWLGKESNVRKIFAKAKARYDLKFPVAFDSVLGEKFRINGYPYILIIDPIGVVRYVTTHVEETNIKQIISYDFSKLPAYPGYVDSAYYLSLLYKPKIYDTANVVALNTILKWDSHGPKYTGYPLGILSTNLKSDKLYLIGFSLEDLYRFAFTSKVSWDNYRDSFYNDFRFFPVLELKDSSAFNVDNKFSKLYSVYIKLQHEVTRDSLRTLLRVLLNNSFGFQAKLEERLSPYWALTVVKGFEQKLVTNGGPVYANMPNGSYFGFQVKNWPIRNLISKLWGHNQLEDKGKINLPFIDETGLHANIDLNLNPAAYIDDFSQFRNELFRNGIELVKKEKAMKCIVIRDAQPSNN